MALLLIFILSMSCLFADGNPNMTFNIVHLIDLKPEYHLLFTDSSAEQVTSVELVDGELNENFVSLYLQHNSNILIKGLTVAASDLETEDKAAAYPYTMIVKDKSGNTVEWTAQEGHGAGYAHIIRKTTVFRYKDTHGETKLADFSIDLSGQSDVASGDYSGTMTLFYEVL